MRLPLLALIVSLTALIACSGPSPSTAALVEAACEAGALRCSGPTIERCIGTSWVAEQNCATLGQACASDEAGVSCSHLSCRDDQIATTGGCFDTEDTIAEQPDPSTPDQAANAPQIAAFYADAYTGAVPFQATMSWAVASPLGRKLRCELDMSGDGLPEVVSEDCLAGREGFTYNVAGRHHALLTVMDDEGRSTRRAQILLANQLVRAENAVALDELEGLAEATYTSGEVELRFDAEAPSPSVEVGQVLRDADGEYRRVSAVTREGSNLRLQTEDASIFDYYASGFFGVKDPEPVVLDPPPGVTATVRSETETETVPKGIAPIEDRTILEVTIDPKGFFGAAGAEVELEWPEASLSLGNPLLSTRYRVKYLLVDISERRYMAIVTSGTKFEADAEIAFRIKDRSVSKFLTHPSLGVSFDAAGLGQFRLGFGLLVELEATLEGKASGHLKLDTTTIFRQDFTAPAFVHTDVNQVGISRSSLTDWKIEAEGEVRFVVKPLVTLRLGAPKLTVPIPSGTGGAFGFKEQDEDCGSKRAFELSMGGYAEVVAAARASVSSAGAQLCFNVNWDAGGFYKLAFPLLPNCAVLELSGVPANKRQLVPAADSGKEALCLPLTPPTCTDSCEEGSTRCDPDRGVMERCIMADRCLEWQPNTTCASGRCADTSSCCTHQCPAEGDSCGPDGSTLRACEANTFGCRSLVEMACARGCSGGRCNPLPSCADSDHDGKSGYAPLDCPEGTDRCDNDPNNWSSAGCACTDADADGYGHGCDRGPDCSESDPFVHANCEVDGPPVFSPAPTLADTVQYLQQAYFGGTVQDTVGLRSLEMRVSGPRGENERAFLADLAGTTAELSGYFFDSTDPDYAGVAGTYRIELRATDSAGQVATHAQDVVVSCEGTGMLPVISATPGAAVVGEATTVEVSVGANNSPTQLQIHCTSPGSQLDGSSANATFIRGAGAAGRLAAPSFTWTTAGTRTIYCTTFDPNWNGECNANRTITVESAQPPPPPPPPIADSEGPQGIVFQQNPFVQGGTTMNVSWQADDYLSGVAELYIDLTLDGGATFSPVASGANLAAGFDPNREILGLFSWLVPDVASSAAAFRMTLLDNVGNLRVLLMPMFTIAPGCAALDAPHLGDPGVAAPLGTYEVMWFPVDGATSYELQESTSESFVAAEPMPFAGTSHLVTGQENGTWYYRVRALSSCTLSPWSPVVSIDVTVDHPPFAPSAPTPADGAIGVSRTPTLRWSGSDAEGAVEYAVWFGSDPGDLGVKRPYDPSQQVDFGSSIAAESTFYWRVRARDVSGATTDGPLWNFTTAPSYPDLVARGIGVVGSVIPDGTVTLELEVQNQGTEPALPCFADFFLSDAPNVTATALFGSRTDVPGLAAGASAIVSKAVRLEGLTPETGYIVAKIDTTDGSLEQVLSNNVISQPVSYVDQAEPVIETVELLWGGGPNNDQFQTGHAYRVISQIHDDVTTPCDAIDLHYSTDAGASWLAIVENLACSADTTQTYVWTIPSNAALTGDALVRLTARDASGNGATGYTAPFYIIDGTGPAVSVTSPNGGETVRLGDSVTLRWTGTDPAGISATSVYLHFGTQVEHLEYALGNPGQYVWSVPANVNFVSDEARIRVVVQDAQGNEATDFSDAPFRIIDASAPPPAPWAMPEAITSTVSCTEMGCLYGAQTPALAVDQAGDVHLAYVYRQNHTDSQATSFVTERIHYMKRTSGTWGSPETIANLGTQSSNATVVQTLDIAVDGAGQPHVVWDYAGTGSSNYFLGDIYTTSRTAGGWDAPTNLSSNASQSRAPRVLVSSTDDVFVFWRDGRTRDPVAGTWSGTTSVYYRSRAAGSSSWAALPASTVQLQVDTFDAKRGAGGLPQLTLLGSDRSLLELAWTGSTWTTPRGFGTCAPVNPVGRPPSMAATSAGAVDVIFLDNDAGNRLKHAFSDGVQQLGCAEVTALSTGQVLNSLARHRNSGLPTSVWIEEASQTSVMARRMLARPAQWSPPVAINLTTQAPMDGQLAYTVGGDDVAHVAWTGYTNGRFEVFYNFANLELDTDAPSVLVTAPSLNEIIPAGASYELEWQAEDAVGVTSVHVLVSFDHGSTWQSIATLPGEATHVSWSVPPAALGALLLQVVAADEAGNEGVALGSASISNAP